MLPSGFSGGVGATVVSSVVDSFPSVVSLVDVSIVDVSLVDGGLSWSCGVDALHAHKITHTRARMRESTFFKFCTVSTPMNKFFKYLDQKMLLILLYYIV